MVALCKVVLITLPMLVMHPCTLFTSMFLIICFLSTPTNTLRFMDLSYAEVTYFIDQVALSAMSFGVAKEDLTVVGTALNQLFNYRCSPPVTVIPSQGPVLESICIDDTCPVAANATCSSYNATMEPAVANATLAGNGTSGTSGTSTASGSATKTSGGSTATGSGVATSTSSAGAVTAGISFAAVAGGVAALFL